VLDLRAAGLRYKEIAFRLRISAGTVKNHVHNAYGKLGVDNIVDALAVLRVD
jgi:two-component system, NarL family, nitrate/nitrite response regulator NarL